MVITGATVVSALTQLIKKSFGTGKRTLLIVFIISIIVAFLIELRDYDEVKNFYSTLFVGLELFLSAVGLYEVSNGTVQKVKEYGVDGNKETHDTRSLPGA